MKPKVPAESSFVRKFSHKSQELVLFCPAQAYPVAIFRQEQSLFYRICLGTHSVALLKLIQDALLKFGHDTLLNLIQNALLKLGQDEAFESTEIPNFLSDIQNGSKFLGDSYLICNLSKPNFNSINRACGSPQTKSRRSPKHNPRLQRQIRRKFGTLMSCSSFSCPILQVISCS